MKHTRKFIVGIAAVPIIIVALAIAALSWVGPNVEVETAGCVGGDRTPATVTLINKEVGNYGSPGHPKVMSVFPNFTYTEFTPEVLPNTGNTSATMTVDVPADFEGEVKVNWALHWYGSDGADSTSGRAVINVVKCVPPTTTTTTVVTTTSTSTTSTTQPTTTTSTTQPSTTTTSTTQPSTTTTSTTQPSTTTTSTTQPSTTTTSSTIPETTTTSSTVPETTTTTEPDDTTTTVYECVPPNVTVPDSPGACLAPPVVIERPAEPAAPVPASPRFTG